ncbi:MAG: hypothetical protein GY938_05320, partial [Ketobacter sp.]|nr:hypothetical protein [Ketobacter sp.]
GLVPASRAGCVTQYTPELCDKLVEASKLGGAPSTWAVRLGIDRTTMHKYRKQFPQFAEAYDLAETYLRSTVEEAFLAQGIHGDVGNTNSLKFFAQTTLGMNERQEVHNVTEVTVKDQRAWRDRVVD